MGASLDERLEEILKGGVLAKEVPMDMGCVEDGRIGIAAFATGQEASGKQGLTTELLPTV